MKENEKFHDWILSVKEGELSLQPLFKKMKKRRPCDESQVSFKRPNF